MSTKETLIAAAGLARRLPTFVSSSTGNASASASITLSAPSGIQDGDLLVFIGNLSNSQPSSYLTAVPSGFVISTDQTNNSRMTVATKVASSESGSYTFTWNNTSGKTAALLVYRNATRVNTVGTLANANSVATGTASSITPTYRGALVAVFRIPQIASVVTPPSGMTSRAVTSGVNPSLAVYDLNPQEAVATGTKSLTWSTSSNNVNSVLLQVTNEPDITPSLVAYTQTQNASNSTSLVIAKPTGTAQGDLMIMMGASSDNGSGDWSGDTDWIEVADQGDGTATTPCLRLAYKVAGASEPSSYTFTTNGSRLLSGTIMTYRYAAYGTISGSFDIGNPLLPSSIAPAKSQSILLACGARGAANVLMGTPIGMSDVAVDSNSISPSYIVCSQSAPKGPSGTRPMTSGSTTGASGVLLAITPTRSL